MIQSIKVFFQESRQELKRVHWPTREETTRYTLFVIGLCLAFAVFLGVLDYLFVTILEFAIL